MDWLLLLLLLPAILIPTVLLCGFAGCGTPLTIEDDPAPSAPDNLTATATGTDRIKLTWHDTTGGTVDRFKLARLDGFTFKELFASITGTPILNSPFEDSGLNDGTDAVYHVSAVAAALESGLSNEAKATTKPNAPANLVASPADINQIALTWNHVTKSNKTVLFKFKYLLKTPPGGASDITPPVTKIGPNAFSCTHIVPEGSDQEFRMIAVVDGFDNSVQKNIESDPSATASARSLAFKTSLTANVGGKKGLCIVQKINAANLHNGGTKVKITLRGSPTGNLTIDKVYISRVEQPSAANPTPDPWDPSAGPNTAGGLTMVATNVILPAGSPSKTLGPIDYTLVRTEDLLIAFDINPATGQGNVISGSLLGAQAYTSIAPAAEASEPFRLEDGYDTEPDLIYLIEKIEVL